MTADHPSTIAQTAPGALVTAIQVAEIVKYNNQGVVVVDVRDEQVLAAVTPVWNLFLERDEMGGLVHALIRRSLPQHM